MKFAWRLGIVCAACVFIAASSAAAQMTGSPTAGYKQNVGLEWTTTSPPPTENFAETPIVTWGAYEYEPPPPRHDAALAR